MPDSLPIALRVRSGLPLVGRDVELAALVAALPGGEAPARAVLVVGEAGSGKTRLVAEVAVRAADRDVRVLHGASIDEVDAPHGPFAEALASFGLFGSVVAGNGQPDAERYRLHRAVAEALARAAGDGPLLLVLEDLHWADEASVALLRALVRSPVPGVLIVGTLRDAPADVGPELATALAELRRAEGVLHLRLAGLPAPEIERWIRGAATVPDEADASALAGELAELTAGNPFLLGEVWRSLSDAGVVVVDGGVVVAGRPLSEVASTDGVRDVVGERLARLGPQTREVLELAALCGPRFRADVLRAAGGADVGTALDDAEARGMIEPLPPAGLAYRFAHELVRRAVADRIPAARRATLHLRVGRALEGLGVASPADLAHHFTAAAGVDPTARDRAVAYGMAAARAASASAAHASAAAYLATVAELEPAGPLSGELAIELGLARTRAGDIGGAVESFRVAAAGAREAGDATLLARAAIGMEDATWRPGTTDAEVLGLLSDAESALPPGDPLLLRVRTCLGRARAYLGQEGPAAATIDLAVAEAREAGDDEALARALVGTYFASAGRAPEEVLAALAEAREVAEGTGRTELAVEAGMWRVVTLARSGECGQAQAERERLAQTAEAAGLPFAMHAAELFASTLALSEGRIDAAEAAAERSREWGEQVRGRDIGGAYGIQMFGIRLQQGRLGEVAPIARMLAARGTDDVWGPGLVALLAETGLHEEARAELTRIVRQRAVPAAGRGLGVAGLVYLAEAAVTLGDRACAAVLRPLVERRRGEVLLVGHLVACFGHAERLAGQLAALTGDLDAAVATLERGVALDAAHGFRTWAAWGGHALSRALRSRAAPGDAVRAAELERGVAEIAEVLGLRALAGRVRPVAPAAQDAGELTAREVVVLRRMAAGRTNRDIGRELVISEHTVANHVRAILRKTGCANRTEAADWARRRGLLDSAPRPE